MSNLAGLWPALQGIGVVGILFVMLWAVSRGAYITRGSHDATIAQHAVLVAELQREIDQLQRQVDRLQSALTARQNTDDDD